MPMHSRGSTAAPTVRVRVRVGVGVGVGVGLTWAHPNPNPNPNPSPNPNPNPDPNPNPNPTRTSSPPTPEGAPRPVGVTVGEGEGRGGRGRVRARGACSTPPTAMGSSCRALAPTSARGRNRWTQAMPAPREPARLPTGVCRCRAATLGAHPHMLHLLTIWVVRCV